LLRDDALLTELHIPQDTAGVAPATFGSSSDNPLSIDPPIIFDDFDGAIRLLTCDD
jgi:hypothetical protein